MYVAGRQINTYILLEKIQKPFLVVNFFNLYTKNITNLLFTIPLCISDTAAMDPIFYSPSNVIPSESKLATYMVS